MVRGSDGAEGLLGAFLIQVVHAALCATKSSLILGHHTDDEALAYIPVTPALAA